MSVTTSSTRVGAAITVGAAVVLLLSGCFFGAGGTATGGGTGGAGQSGGSDGTSNSDGGDSESPGDIDLDQFEGLPATFPSDEIPIIDGEIELGVDLGTGWSLLMRVDDTEAAYADASQKLKNAGFEPLAEQSSPDESFGAFENDKYQVQVTCTDTPDNGPSANYVVVLKS